MNVIKNKIPLLILAALVVLALAAYLFLNFANPQWHWRLYAYQAQNSENGQIDPSSSYTGAWNNWDAEGRLLSHYSYRNGKRDGPYVVYNNQGQILSEGQYSKGELNGLQKINQDGSRTEVFFKDGKREGMEKTWYPSGQIAVEAPWVNGVQEGSVVFYYEGGKVQATIPFYQGKIEGVQKTWYEDGAPQGEESYRNNLRSGRSQFWRQDGSRDMSLNYRDDKMDGLQTWYHPNGQKAKELILSQGEPDGPWREWDESGKLLVDDMYEKGELKKKDKEEKAAPSAKETAGTDKLGNSETPPTGDK